MVDENVYPQLAKLEERSPDIAVVRDFFEWLDEQGLDLCRVERGPGHDRYLPVFETRDATLYRFAGIDPIAIENERRALLASMPRGVPTSAGKINPSKAP
jgi:hypothetical protein